MKTVAVPLRWGDMDAQGHVNNAAFLDYLQEARVEFLLSVPELAPMLGTGLVVVSHQVEYLAPVEFSAKPVLVNLSIVEAKGAQFVVAYEVWHDGRRCVRARTRLCAFCFETSSVRRFTPTERATLTGLVEGGEPLRAVARKPVGQTAMAAPLRVRWSDLDSYGHVNNVVFFDYVQQGRVALSAAMPAAPELASASHDDSALWLVVRQDIDYTAQLGFRVEPFEVRTGVAAFGSTSTTFCSQIVDPGSGTVFAKALSVVVTADRTGRPRAVPQEWRDALAAYVL